MLAMIIVNLSHLTRGGALCSASQPELNCRTPEFSHLSGASVILIATQEFLIAASAGFLLCMPPSLQTGNSLRSAHNPQSP